MGARILTVLPTRWGRLSGVVRPLALVAALGGLAMTTGCLAQAESQDATQDEQVGQVGSALNAGQEEIVVTGPAVGGTDSENGPEPDPWHTRTLNAGGPEPDPWHPQSGSAAASGASGTGQGNSGGTGTGKN